MKPLNEPVLAKMRREHPEMGWGDDSGGYFHLNNMRIIASSAGGWDHVSVSLIDRCPTWLEMVRVKRLFFHDYECVMQLHPPEANYVNIHNFVLHLWRPQNQEIPMPPVEFV